MSIPAEIPQATEPALGERLAYLLKHAQLALSEITTPALAPLRITGRDLGTLTVLGAGEPLSQQQAAARLGVDRTTMVDLIDMLEGRALVERRPDPSDRRRNLVQLTDLGRRALDAGRRRALEAERHFLAPLSEAEGEQFRAMLQRLLGLAPGAPPARD